MAVAVGSGIVVFSVVSVVSVVVIVVGGVGIRSSRKKLSSSASAALSVDCVSGCGSWEVVMVGGSHRSVFVVVSVVIVVGCVVGCVVGIVVVTGIIVLRISSRSKLARMLAFSASKSMRCVGGVVGRGCEVGGVTLVGAGVGVVGVIGECVVGIGVVSVVVRKAVSLIKPA